MATRLRYIHGPHRGAVAVLQDDVYASSLIATGYASLEPDEAPPTAEEKAEAKAARVAAREARGAELNALSADDVRDIAKRLDVEKNTKPENIKAILAAEFKK